MGKLRDIYKSEYIGRTSAYMSNSDIFKNSWKLISISTEFKRYERADTASRFFPLCRPRMSKWHDVNPPLSVESNTAPFSEGVCVLPIRHCGWASCLHLLWVCNEMKMWYTVCYQCLVCITLLSFISISFVMNQYYWFILILYWSFFLFIHLYVGWIIQNAWFFCNIL